MKKVIYNNAFGGFYLTPEAKNILTERYGWTEDRLSAFHRHDSDLVAVVEELGKDAGEDLEICAIKGNKYKIFEYDGAEIVITPEDEDWIVIEEIPK